MAVHKVSQKLSTLVLGLSVLVVLIGLPFVLIAGTGLILTIPFGLFVRSEHVVLRQIKDGSRVSRRQWTSRRLSIASCIFALESVAAILWLSNRTNYELSQTERLSPLIYATIFSIVFAVLAFLVEILDIKSSKNSLH